MCMIGATVKVRRVPRHRAIRAYRLWTYEAGFVSPVLKSWARSYYWTTGTNTTRVPTPRNYQGFWGYKTRARLEREITVEYDHDRIGVVKLWGVVVEHERGYRGQHAEIATPAIRKLARRV